jgi:hypothetical protein
MTALGIRIVTGLRTVIRTEERPMRRKVGSITFAIDCRLGEMAEAEGTDYSSEHRTCFLPAEPSERTNPIAR